MAPTNLDDHEVLRDVNVDGYRLTTFDLGGVGLHASQWRVGYRFHALDGSILFAGDDFGCSPLHAIDSDECLRALLSFLTLRPGDTDAEYFAHYTPAQRAFADGDAEALSLWTIEDEHDLGDVREFVDWPSTSRGRYVCQNEECGNESGLFVVPPCCIQVPGLDPETGVIVNGGGTVTNRWDDGSVGVSDEAREIIQDHIDGGCPPHCADCNEEAEWQGTLRGRRACPDERCTCTVGPGKFEGEPVETFLAWQMVVEGGGEEHGTWSFFSLPLPLSPDDHAIEAARVYGYCTACTRRAASDEWETDDTAIWLAVSEDVNGFVHHRTFDTDEEKAAFAAEADAVDGE